MRTFRLSALASLTLLLGGCNAVLLSPSGDVALQQRNMLLISTALMLLIIVPVMALTIGFAWHYRASNRQAVYDPDWHHSTGLEVVIWTAPLLIIIALGALTWLGTHLLDPYRPIGRLAATRPLTAGSKALTVQVVALDWKWLFLYPDHGIATVNEVAAPVDQPIQFRITSAAVMNSFFVPALAGQIYAMPGMETKLHAVINREGEYEGFSANYSGAGFSKMNFKFRGLSQGGFEQWVAKAKEGGARLDRAAYGELEKPSEQEPVRFFPAVEDGLYDAILNLCAEPGKMCLHEMMGIDAKGGAGVHSQGNRDRLLYDGARARDGFEAPGATVPASGRGARSEERPDGLRPGGGGPSGGEPARSAPHGGHHGMPGGGPAPGQLNTR